MSTYPRSPKLLKGALIELSERFIGPVPNIIVFQYNPETMTRMADNVESADWAKRTVDPTAQPIEPKFAFSLDLEFDAADDLEKPEDHPVTTIFGVAARIAALEVLLYPQEGGLDGLLGSAGAALTGAVSGPLGGAINKALDKTGIGTGFVPRNTIPVLLFAWGPGRILPVRITKFSVKEEAYSPTLYPIRATVTVALEVLIPDSFSDTDNMSVILAKAAYKYTRKQTNILAAANTAKSVESILAMLPF